MGQTLLINDLFPLPAPSFISAQDPGGIRVPVYDKNLFHIVPCLQIDHQMILIQRIAHLFGCFMIYCCKIHLIPSRFLYILPFQRLIYAEKFSHAPRLGEASF